MRGSVSMSKGHHGQRYDEHFKKMIVELVESNQVQNKQAIKILED